MRVRLDADRSVWAEERIPGGWFARARMVVQGGRAVVAELRLSPTTQAAPPGGITQAVVRRVPLGQFGPYLVAARTFAKRAGIGGLLQHFDATIGAALPGLWTDEATERPRPRRAAGRDDRFYAMLARDYLKAINDGSRTPIKALASARKLKPATVRDMVHEARVRGLLGPGEPGRLGGELLPRAGALLERKGGPR